MLGIGYDAAQTWQWSQGLHPKSDPDAEVDDDPILRLNDKSPGAVGWVDTGGASLQARAFGPCAYYLGSFLLWCE